MKRLLTKVLVEIAWILDELSTKIDQEMTGDAYEDAWVRRNK